MKNNLIKMIVDKPGFFLDDTVVFGDHSLIIEVHYLSLFLKRNNKNNMFLHTNYAFFKSVI